RGQGTADSDNRTWNRQAFGICLIGDGCLVVFSEVEQCELRNLDAGLAGGEIRERQVHKQFPPGVLLNDQILADVDYLERVHIDRLLGQVVEHEFVIGRVVDDDEVVELITSPHSRAIQTSRKCDV